MRDSYNFASAPKEAGCGWPSRTEPEETNRPSRLPVANIAAAFQESVVEALEGKTVEAAEEFEVRQVLLAGGVAANSRLRQVMSQSLKGIPLRYPPKRWCTDNAAMVAAAAYYQQGEVRVGWDLDVYPGLRLPASAESALVSAAS